MKNYEILQNFNVLYLEDDINLLKNLSEILEDFVNKIYTADNIADAYKILIEKNIDVIISDILIGDKNSLEFISFLKEKNIEIPVILTTAYTEIEYLLEAIKLKAINYLVKPIKVKELLDSLYEVLLPKYQQNELEKNAILFKIVSLMCESKQFEVIKMMIKKIDNNYTFSLSYNEIMKTINISKPTLIKLFKELQDRGILKKLPKRKYKIDVKKLEEELIKSTIH